MLMHSSTIIPEVKYMQIMVTCLTCEDSQSLMLMTSGSKAATQALRRSQQCLGMQPARTLDNAMLALGTELVRY